MLFCNLLFKKEGELITTLSNQHMKKKIIKIMLAVLFL